ncbi:hypothetical protein IV203_031437 [Nitzschia inconspicua]|uniref:F-box domain-containing protein n=1 Tax=Nitzschia inconspicua TaxID=303405 RepID=A0A9K3LVC1_9STRA|nr:hypothetical protein IV203_031429 [Nitzschia inconspicua]KAG7368694.1 hypothetical protein IV203_031437 [Nitzschia inconspicua]
MAAMTVMNQTCNVKNMEVESLQHGKTLFAFSEETRVVKEVTRINATSFLETKMTDQNIIHIILSFLTLTDYNQLCRTSKVLNTAVYKSSHLFAENCVGLFRSSSTWCNKDRNQSTFPKTVEETTGFSTRNETPPVELNLLLNRFPYLKEINLHGLAPVGDDLIRILNESKSANQFTSVSLHGLALSYWCPHTLQLERVQNLTLSGNSIRVRVSNLIRNLKCLQSLTVLQCPGIRDEDVQDLAQVSHKTLRELTLSHVKIVHPTGDFPNLKKASFVGCFGLKDLSGLWTPNLSELNISFCVRLSSEQIQSLLERLPALGTLIMMKCNGVKTLELASLQLRQLDTTFTHNLEVLRLSCPNLEKLETHCCSSLEEVVLYDAASLPVLNFSGSFRLRQVQVFGAHNLTYLSLRGCRNLHICHFDTPHLQCANVTGARTVALRHCKHVRTAILRSWSSSK